MFDQFYREIYDCNLDLIKKQDILSLVKTKLGQELVCLYDMKLIMISHN